MEASNSGLVPHEPAQPGPDSASGREPWPDDPTPPDLIPIHDNGPVERVLYSRVFLHKLFNSATDGMTDLCAVGPIDVLDAGGGGFTGPAVGVRLTVSQSWHSERLALGQLLHSIALAPGESTRIAVVDWQRTVTDAIAQKSGQSDEIASGMASARAISEVTGAVARESQTGSSTATTDASASQWGAGGGAAVGAAGVAGPAVIGGGVGAGGAYGSGTSSAVATNVATTEGSRDLAATMTQDITDTTHQHANAVRSRRASVVREARTGEHEEATTRVIANYNHMHAMTVQYYEVVQLYRVETVVERCERVLFLPLKEINFSPFSVTRFRELLVASALTPSARLMLQRWRNQLEWKMRMEFSWGQDHLNFVENRLPLDSDDPQESESAAAKVVVARTKAQESKDAFTNAIDTACGAVYACPAPGDDSTTLSVPADLLISKLRLAPAPDAEVTMIVKQTGGKQLSAPCAPGDGDGDADFGFNDPLTVGALSGLYLKLPAGGEMPESMTLEVTFEARGGTATIPYDLSLLEVEPNKEVLVFAVEQPTDGDEAGPLLKHLNDHRLHYSQAVWSALPPYAAAKLIADSEWDGSPLVNSVDLRPVAVTGNYIGFLWKFTDCCERKKFEEEHNKCAKPPDSFVPCPSGGVFAEAVLGRANSAEKLDPTRFWNWQDSPPPLRATAISPVEFGKRKGEDATEIKPIEGTDLTFQYSGSKLPDPQGLSAMIGALTNGAMFRDMSGMDKTMEAAMAGQKGAQDAAQSGSEQATKNMEVAAEIQKEAVKEAATAGIKKAEIAADIQKKAIEAAKPLFEAYGEALKKDAFTQHIAKQLFNAAQGSPPAEPSEPAKEDPPADDPETPPEPSESAKGDPPADDLETPATDGDK